MAKSARGPLQLAWLCVRVLVVGQDEEGGDGEEGFVWVCEAEVGMGCLNVQLHVAHDC